jgi:hypothetical protein
MGTHLKRRSFAQSTESNHKRPSWTKRPPFQGAFSKLVFRESFPVRFCRQSSCTLSYIPDRTNWTTKFRLENHKKRSSWALAPFACKRSNISKQKLYCSSRIDRARLTSKRFISLFARGRAVHVLLSHKCAAPHLASPVHRPVSSSGRCLSYNALCFCRTA